MKVTRIYKDNGDSAFKDMEISFERTGVDTYISLPNPPEMILVETDAREDNKWRQKPKEQCSKTHTILNATRNT